MKKSLSVMVAASALAFTLATILPVTSQQGKTQEKSNPPAKAQKEAKETEPENPTISTELRAEFWRTNTEILVASSQMKDAQDKLKAAQDKMGKIQDVMRKQCGEWTLVGDMNGEPACQLKPKPPAPDQHKK